MLYLPRSADQREFPIQLAPKHSPPCSLTPCLPGTLWSPHPSSPHPPDLFQPSLAHLLFSETLILLPQTCAALPTELPGRTSGPRELRVQHCRQSSTQGTPLCFQDWRNSFQINRFGRKLVGSELCQDFSQWSKPVSSRVGGGRKAQSLKGFSNM